VTGNLISETTRTFTHLCWGGQCVTLAGEMAAKAENYLKQFEGASRAVAVQRLVDAAVRDGVAWPKADEPSGAFEAPGEAAKVGT